MRNLPSPSVRAQRSAARARSTSALPPRGCPVGNARTRIPSPAEVPSGNWTTPWITALEKTRMVMRSGNSNGVKNGVAARSSLRGRISAPANRSRSTLSRPSPSVTPRFTQSLAPYDASNWIPSTDNRSSPTHRIVTAPCVSRGSATASRTTARPVLSPASRADANEKSLGIRIPVLEGPGLVVPSDVIIAGESLLETALASQRAARSETTTTNNDQVRVFVEPQPTDELSEFIPMAV